MDVDAFITKFRPMLEDMFPEWQAHKDRQKRRAEEEAAEPFESGVNDANRDEIYAPLPAPVAAAEAEAEARTDLPDAGQQTDDPNNNPAQVGTGNASGGPDVVTKGSADAEIVPIAEIEPTDDAGQNQQQGAGEDAKKD